MKNTLIIITLIIFLTIFFSLFIPIKLIESSKSENTSFFNKDFFNAKYMLSKPLLFDTLFCDYGITFFIGESLNKQYFSILILKDENIKKMDYLLSLDVYQQNQFLLILDNTLNKNIIIKLMEKPGFLDNLNRKLNFSMLSDIVSSHNPSLPNENSSVDFLNLIKYTFNKSKNVEVLSKLHNLNLPSSKYNDIKQKEMRIIRAIKERQCSIILNLSENEYLLDYTNCGQKNCTAFLKKQTSGGVLINTELMQINRYYGLLANVLLIILYLYLFYNVKKEETTSVNNFLQSRKNFFKNLFKRKKKKFTLYKPVILLSIINFSILLVFFVVFNFIIKHNKTYINYLIEALQISTFLVHVMNLVFIAYNHNFFKHKKDAYKNQIEFILINFISGILNGIIINSLTYFSNWLMFPQDFVFFFYFFPFFVLFIKNIINKKEKIQNASLYLIFLMIFYLFEKLRETGILTSKVELEFRNFLDLILPARFRMKEFLAYFLIFSYIEIPLMIKKRTKNAFIKKFSLNFVKKVRLKYTTIFDYLFLFPSLLSINSFYHSYTPCYISFLRSTYALIFGFIISKFFIIIIFKSFPIKRRIHHFSQ